MRIREIRIAKNARVAPWSIAANGAMGWQGLSNRSTYDDFQAELTGLRIASASDVCRFSQVRSHRDQQREGSSIHKPDE